MIISLVGKTLPIVLKSARFKKSHVEGVREDGSEVQIRYETIRQIVDDRKDTTDEEAIVDSSV